MGIPPFAGPPTGPVAEIGSALLVGDILSRLKRTFGDELLVEFLKMARGNGLPLDGKQHLPVSRFSPYAQGALFDFLELFVEEETEEVRSLAMADKALAFFEERRVEGRGQLYSLTHLSQTNPVFTIFRGREYKKPEVQQTFSLRTMDLLLQGVNLKRLEREKTFFVDERKLIYLMDGLSMERFKQNENMALFKIEELLQRVPVYFLGKSEDLEASGIEELRPESIQVPPLSRKDFQRINRFFCLLFSGGPKLIARSIPKIDAMRQGKLFQAYCRRLSNVVKDAEKEWLPYLKEAGLKPEEMEQGRRELASRVGRELERRTIEIFEAMGHYETILVQKICQDHPEEARRLFLIKYDIAKMAGRFNKAIQGDPDLREQLRHLWSVLRLLSIQEEALLKWKSERGEPVSEKSGQYKVNLLKMAGKLLIKIRDEGWAVSSENVVREGTPVENIASLTDALSKTSQELLSQYRLFTKKLLATLVESQPATSSRLLLELHGPMSAAQEKKQEGADT